MTKPENKRKLETINIRLKRRKKNLFILFSFFAFLGKRTENCKNGNEIIMHVPFIAERKFRDREGERAETNTMPILYFLP